jgi:hypothetical protein
MSEEQKIEVAYCNECLCEFDSESGVVANDNQLYCSEVCANEVNADLNND